MAPLDTDHDSARDREWSQLMSHAQRGDRLAYDQLLRQTLPFVRAIVARQHRTADRIEDIVQDVLLTVHRVRQTYDPSRPFSHWLATIARRRSIDALRRKGRIDASEVADGFAYETFADPSANRPVEANEAAASLRGAMAGLPRGQREALELLKLQQLSLADASQRTGKSVAALKVTVHRAIKSLKTKMKGE
jgi:RNA polymerase sigma-70 factor (ECF subfamily)